MKLIKSYWFLLTLSILVFLGGAFLKWLSTADAPTYDGSVKIGFPFTFHQYGGYCIGGPCSSFSLVGLILDVLLVIAVPLIIKSLIVIFTKNKF